VTCGAFDDPRLALDLSQVSARPRHLVELEKQVFAAGGGGVADPLAAPAVHQEHGSDYSQRQCYLSLHTSPAPDNLTAHE